MPAVVHQLSFIQRWSLRAGTILFRAVIYSLRIRLSDGAKQFLVRQPRSSLILLWHNRLAMALSSFYRNGKGIPMTGLVSASTDGALLAEVMHAFGVQTARGSSSRRAVEATRELIAALDAGRNVVITPDGPRGPIYTVKEGAATVGREHARGIYLFGFHCDRVWRLNSWDQFMFPKPFATLDVHVVQMEMTDQLDAATLQQKLREINKE